MKERQRQPRRNGIDFNILRFIIRQSAVLAFDLDAFALLWIRSRP